jgi:multidrug efflux pump
MANFFIDRPVFAWVLSIFIMIAGAIAIPLLPVAQYPNVAPPQISITTSYPGASAEEIYRGVTRLIEDELNGVDGLMYFESTSDSAGQISINVSFDPGTPVEQAAVDVQNRLRRVEPRLPRPVVQQGLLVQEASSAFVMVISLTSMDGSGDVIGLGDYLTRNVLSELRRIDGVGNAQLWASQRAMRVWIDPDRMVGLGLTSDDIVNAIQAQNAQVAAGRIGAQPIPASQQISALSSSKASWVQPMNSVRLYSAPIQMVLLSDSGTLPELRLAVSPTTLPAG